MTVEILEPMENTKVYIDGEGTRMETTGIVEGEGITVERTYNPAPERMKKRKYINKRNGAELIVTGIVEDPEWEEKPIK